MGDNLAERSVMRCKFWAEFETRRNDKKATDNDDNSKTNEMRLKFKAKLF